MRGWLEAPLGRAGAQEGVHVLGRRGCRAPPRRAAYAAAALRAQHLRVHRLGQHAPLCAHARGGGGGFQKDEPPDLVSTRGVQRLTRAQQVCVHALQEDGTLCMLGLCPRSALPAAAPHAGAWLAHAQPAAQAQGGIRLCSQAQNPSPHSTMGVHPLAGRSPGSARQSRTSPARSCPECAARTGGIRPRGRAWQLTPGCCWPGRCHLAREGITGAAGRQFMRRLGQQGCTGCSTAHCSAPGACSCRACERLMLTAWAQSMHSVGGTDLVDLVHVGGRALGVEVLEGLPVEEDVPALLQRAGTSAAPGLTRGGHVQIGWGVDAQSRRLIRPGWPAVPVMPGWSALGLRARQRLLAVWPVQTGGGRRKSGQLTRPASLPDACCRCDSRGQGRERRAERASRALAFKSWSLRSFPARAFSSVDLPVRGRALLSRQATAAIGRSGARAARSARTAGRPLHVCVQCRGPCMHMWLHAWRLCTDQRRPQGAHPLLGAPAAAPGGPAAARSPSVHVRQDKGGPDRVSASG